MDTALIKGKFARMGARLKIDAARSPDSVVDIGRDRRGEFFAIDRGRETEIQVLDIRPAQRHLLLQLVDGDGPRLKHKFLCGHDERHWFVAAVPWGTRSANVESVPVGVDHERRIALPVVATTLHRFLGPFRVLLAKAHGDPASIGRPARGPERAYREPRQGSRFATRGRDDVNLRLVLVVAAYEGDATPIR